jgi:glycosyltransferase involved in cell wall biosynthesis
MSNEDKIDLNFGGGGKAGERCSLLTPPKKLSQIFRPSALPTSPAATFPRIKILHLIVTLNVGGAEDLLQGIVSSLDPGRFHSVIACLGELGPLGEELGAAGFPVISLGLNLKRHSWGRILTMVRRLIRREQPDILHTHLYHAILYGRLASLGSKVKGVVASVVVSYTHPKLHRRLWNFLLWPLTDRLVVGSAQVYADVRRYDGVPPSRLRLLPYGIRLEELALSLSPATAKAELGISGFCLGTVGRLEEQKGQKYLLAALPHLRREIPDLTVLVVGSGRLAESLKKQARELRVDDVVRFLGTRRDLPLLYRAMDIFVLPSLWEGLSLALLKAMAAGLPVVATNISGTQDVIADYGNGRLIPSGQPEKLAAAIVELYHKPQLRQTLGRQAQQTIQAGYSLQAMVKKLEEIYLQIM